MTLLLLAKTAQTVGKSSMKLLDRDLEIKNGEQLFAMILAMITGLEKKTKLNMKLQPGQENWKPHPPMSSFKAHFIQN